MFANLNEALYCLVVDKKCVYTIHKYTYTTVGCALVANIQTVYTFAD